MPQRTYPPVIHTRRPTWLARSPLWARALALVGVALCVGMVWPLPSKAAEPGGWKAGISVQPEASAADTDLPAYPGAKPWVEKGRKSADQGDGDSAFINIFAGSFGVKVAVAKYVTSDTPEQVLAFYQPAMARFGAVLDCASAEGRATARRNGGNDSGDSPVRCDEDQPQTTERVLKVGTKRQQRVLEVTATPGQGTVFTLVKVHVRGG